MGEENLELKKKLILQSFLPLFILILIKYFDYRAIVSAIHFIQHLSRGEFAIIFNIWGNQFVLLFVVMVVSIIWIFSGIIAIWQFKNVQTSGFVDAGEKIDIDEELTDSGITFFVSFVLPLLIDDIGSIQGFLVFSGILGLVILLMWKTNLYYQNPVLTILGYKVYKFHFINPSRNGCKEKEYIAVCKSKLVKEKIVEWKYISDNVCVMYNKN
ncbi:MAG TPA: hypothetical protein VJZ04_10500 [Lachnospiraceae bacterium]|nr:hypothetical protein [Lachnospiraceae bacterium]